MRRYSITYAEANNQTKEQWVVVDARDENQARAAILKRNAFRVKVLSVEDQGEVPS